MLTAARESVVLYADWIAGCTLAPDPPDYIWNVDPALVEQARRLIDAFRVLFSDELPPPEPARAELYWHACEENEILGRCVRLGYNDATSPVLQYHWAICRRDYALEVHEFWHPELWTSERYSTVIGYDGRCPNL